MAVVDWKDGMKSRGFNKELWMSRSRPKFDGLFRWQEECRVLEQ
jgi:hypothetical protein